MTSRWLALGCALLLAACATRAPSPDAFSFAVMGDTPYNDREEVRFLEMIQRVNAEAVAFVVHVGDFKGGGACSDALYARRKAQFDGSEHAFIYTPGDNEWTDCRRADMGGMDPIERLARLRQVFFAERRSLGRHPIENAAQDACIAPVLADCGCSAHPENRIWSRAGVRFVTLDIPGSDNNVGFDRANDAEARCRDEANRQWLERALRASEDATTRALVVMTQANPWESSRKPVYADFLRQIEGAARRLAKPVLLIHGDTHTYRVDFPFVGVTRLETFGSPFVGWVKVSVDPADPVPFRFQAHLIALVP